MNWYSSSSLQLIINDLNEIAADAYRHRIRPRSKKGGNGVYDTSNGGFSYILPFRFSFNNRAHFELLKSGPDRLVLRASSLENQKCFVTAVVDLRGRLRNIRTPDETVLPASSLRNERDPGPVKTAAQAIQFFKVFEDL